MSTPDFFHSRLDGMIGLRHPLAVLASRMPWNNIDAALAPVLAHKANDGRTVFGEDLFGNGCPGDLEVFLVAQRKDVIVCVCGYLSISEQINFGAGFP